MLVNGKKRRAAFAAAFCAAMIADLAAAQERPPLKQSARIAVSAEAIRLDRANPGRKTFGKLEFICGLALKSPAPQFGGLSAFAISGDGAQILALTDEGAWFSARLAYDNACLSGLRDAKLGPLLGENGKPLSSKRSNDAEGLALLHPAELNGPAYISFERRHRIGKYQVKNGEIAGRPEAVPLPAAVRKLSNNGGIEGVAILREGRLKGAIVAFAEMAPGTDGDDKPAPGWLIAGGKTEALSLKTSDGFNITDLAAMPNGDLLVLERRFKSMLSGVFMRIRLIEANAIAGGKTLDGPALIELGGHAFNIDNMEGLAVHVNAGGETVLTVISDDNFSGLQRTLLMQFIFRQ